MRAIQATPSPKVEAITLAPGAAPRYRPAHSFFLPMLLTLLSLQVWFGFQGWQLWKERASFAAAVQRQGPRLERARQFRVELESLSADTAHLAAVGDANAQLLVDALKQRGVVIGADKTRAAAGGTSGSLPLPVFSQTPVDAPKK